MSRKRLKQYLTLLMAIGVIAIVAGGTGTFASFNAVVEHTGNTYATGTLLLHSTGTPAGSTTATTCASESNSSNSNTTSTTNIGSTTATGCAVLFNNISLGVPGSGTLSGTITSGTSYSTLPLSSLSAGVEPGDVIQLTNASSQTDKFTVTKAVAATSSTVSIPVIARAATNSYAAGDTAAVQTYTQYADIQLTNKGTLDAKDIKFSVPGCNNSAVQTLTLGTTSGSLTAGTLSSASIGITASAYGAPSGDTITVTDGTNSDTLTLGSAVNPGDTSITASGTLSHSYSSGATVKYSPFISGSGALCGNLDYVIVETDSLYHHDSSNAAQKCSYGTKDSTSSGIGCTFSSSTNLGAGPATDTALDISNATTGTGTANTAGELDSKQSRYFVLGIQADVSSLTNSSQNQKATFAVQWRIDQK